MTKAKPRCADCGHVPAKSGPPLVQHGTDLLCHRKDASCYGRRLALGGDTPERHAAKIAAAIKARRGALR